MAIALVTGQVKSASGAGIITLDVVLPGTPANGNFVVCCVTLAATARDVTSVADGNGNTFTRSTNSPSANANTNSETYIYYLPNVSNGHATITITADASTGIRGFAAEFSGVATTTPLDVDAAHAAITAQTNVNDPSVTPSEDGELLIGACHCGSNVTSADTPFTGIDAIQTRGYAEYYIQPTAGAQAIAFTQTSAAQWSGMIAAFKAAAAATGNPWYQFAQQ